MEVTSRTESLREDAMRPNAPAARIHEAAEAVGLGKPLSRRGFLLFTACAVTSLAALGLNEAFGADPPLVILDNAQGIILADPSRCVGCQRCELACVEFNDGRAQPSLARIKVARSLNFGPQGPVGGPGMQGAFGNGLVAQGVCRQCPHPVPCATACPQNAIQLDSSTGARVVKTQACIGCRLCQTACPWDMIVFDEATQTSSKCFLCHGKPKCVEACPAEALRYVAWRDLTRDGKTPGARLALIPAKTAAACLECHAPGGATPAPK